MDTVQKFRHYRSKKLGFLAQGLIKAGLNANHLTFLSLLSGLAAVYFLFNSYYLFALFVLLHLIFDSLDGVVARATKITYFGKYVDMMADSSVTFLVLLKAAWFLQELYAYLAAGLFLLTLVIHLVSRLQAPMVFIRTVTLAVVLIATHPQFPYQILTLTFEYLAAGGVSLYSLARQLQWRINHGKSR